MPNMIDHVDVTTHLGRKEALKALLPPLRDTIFEDLKMPDAARQLAAILVRRKAGQSVANCGVQSVGGPKSAGGIIARACTVFANAGRQLCGPRP